jgi:hypothetical protein
MNLAPDLAAVDRDLAELEEERSRVLERWANALNFPEPPSAEETRLRERLDDLDLEIERLTIRRHRIVSLLRGERHLKSIPCTQGRRERKQA